MSLKSWVLHRVHQVNGLSARNDLPPREPDFESTRPAPAADSARVDGGMQATAPRSLSDAEHLGAYGPLIGAIRDELEHFVASHVRLHVVIADRDRFVLTSLGVRCAGTTESRQLLQQFMREFKPEQVKRYLTREVIGALPNASAIDLSQFAGLFDADARADADAQASTASCSRRCGTPAEVPLRPYEVSVLGRWTGRKARGPRRAGTGRRPSGTTPSAPLAGRRCGSTSTTPTDVAGSCCRRGYRGAAP
jgi:hypothetical protein